MHKTNEIKNSTVSIERKKKKNNFSSPYHETLKFLLNWLNFTWHIVHITAIDKQMTILVITYRWKYTGYWHTGAYISPKTTYDEFNEFDFFFLFYFVIVSWLPSLNHSLCIAFYLIDIKWISISFCICRCSKMSEILWRICSLLYNK